MNPRSSGQGNTLDNEGLGRRSRVPLFAENLSEMRMTERRIGGVLLG